MSQTDKRDMAARTRLIHGSRQNAADGRCFVNPGLIRGSTVLHPSVEDRVKASGEFLDQALIYGIEGTPTHFALENMISSIEGGTRTQIVSTGLQAVTVALMAYARRDGHLLVPDSVYGPSRSFCDALLVRFGIETTYYPPTERADDLAKRLRPETIALYIESPGSHTFEMQDVPALAAVARRFNVPVLMDNTWGIHFFQPFQHGVDVSIQALTKYVGGHSDILLGAITTNHEDHWKKIRTTAMLLGAYASSDDCWLALRGARTLAIRLDHQMRAGLEVANWFAQRAEVAEVRHPALPGAPGHDIWKSQFTGAPSLFGVVFRSDIPEENIRKMLNSLSLFGIGVSWGGYESLALPSSGIRRSEDPGISGISVRFHIGLEEISDLIRDLEQAFRCLA